MPKNFLQLFLALNFLLIFSCQKPKPITIEPFILSSLPNIQAIERQDNNFCSSLNISFNKDDQVKNMLYWRCRLTMAKNHLSTDKLSPQADQNNLEISNLIAKISLKISQDPQSILLHENQKMNNRQHKKCLELGYQNEVNDQTKIDDYFLCRKALIDEQQESLSFGSDYSKYPNNSYNIGFVIDEYIDAENSKYRQKKAQYPACVKFNLYGSNFQNCVAAQDNSRQCFTKIEKQKFKKEWEEKIFCQKQSYVNFPNEFLKENETKKAELEKVNNNSDFYNKYSFSALGLNVNQFGGKAEEADLPQEDLMKKINSKNHLYSKFELTRLRKQYISACQKEADLRIEKYVSELEKSCVDLTKFEIIGEE
jgi:hypothetical protein